MSYWKRLKIELRRMIMAGKVLTIDDVEVDVEVNDENKCPNCGGKIIRAQGCRQCQECGTRLC